MSTDRAPQPDIYLRPDTVRNALVLAAARHQPKRSPLTADFLAEATALIADREPEEVDPVTEAARTLAAAMDTWRTLFDDTAYGTVALPAFETLRRMLPDDDAPPVPQRLRSVPSPRMPWEEA